MPGIIVCSCMRLRPTGAVPPGPAGASPDGSTERMEKQPKWFGCNWQATWVGGGKPGLGVGVGLPASGALLLAAPHSA